MATNTSDLKAYWQELAKKANLPEDKAKAVFEALGDEVVEKVFKDGFKPIPDYSRDLDSVRDRTRAETGEAVKAYYDTWYQTKALPELTKKEKEVADYKAAVDQYRQVYGENDGKGKGSGRENVTPSGDLLSKAGFTEFNRQREQA